jgi:parallel beta-helix repeat protein
LDHELKISIKPIQGEEGYLFDNSIDFGVYVYHYEEGFSPEDNTIFDCEAQELNPILGQGSYSEKTAINLTNKRNVTIRNCIIQGWDNGIYLFNSSYNTLKNNKITKNTYRGVYLRELSNNNIILDNLINETVHYMADHNKGLYIYSSYHNKLINNTITKNIYGVYFLFSYNNTLINNTINNNSHSGYYSFSDGGNESLIGNTVNNNQFGIRLGGPHILIKNRACSNNETDIACAGGSTGFGNYFNKVQCSDNILVYGEHYLSCDALIKSLINNTGKDIIHGDLLMKVQKYDGTKWQDYEIIVNDSTPKTILPGKYLALDTVWADHGYFTPTEQGNYRVYAVLRNKNGAIIETEQGLLEDYYDFYVPYEYTFVDIGDGGGNIGSYANPILIDMANPQEVSKINFTIVETPDYYLEVSGVNVVGRAAENNFTASFDYDGQKVTVSLTSSTGDLIPIGEGPIAEILYDVKYYASNEEVILKFSDLLLLDSEGDEIEVENEPGTFKITYPNSVDISDGSGTIGSTGNSIFINLKNIVDVFEGRLTILDTPNYLEVI